MSTPEDDRLFAQAANEIANGTADLSLMARAWSESGGKSDAASAAYIRLRVERLRAERKPPTVPRDAPASTLSSIDQKLPTSAWGRLVFGFGIVMLVFVMLAIGIVLMECASN